MRTIIKHFRLLAHVLLVLRCFSALYAGATVVVSHTVRVELMSLLYTFSDSKNKMSN